MLKRFSTALAAAWLGFAAPCLAAQQTVNVGTSANDGSGDTLRAAFGKVNANTAELYAAIGVRQPLSAILTGLAGLAPGADQAIYAIGPSTFATTPLPAYGRSLIGAASAIAARSILGLGAAAVLNVGTATGTVAAGDDTRIVGAAQKTANLSDLTSIPAARTSLGLGSLALQGAGAVAITGGTIDGTAIGETTPASATFTTLAASGLTLGTPLPLSQGGCGATTALGCLTNLGLSGGTVGYVLTSNGPGTAPTFQAAAGATNAVLYTAQSLTSGQQDQVRANLSAPASSAPSTATTLATTDIDRPLFPTSTTTITAANGGSGWRTGPIKNANTASGIVTLAVPSGATLDGVTNGTTALWPYQRARIVQTGATAYVTDWIERRAILATRSLTSTTLTSDFVVPVGFPKVTMSVLGARVVTNGANFVTQFSDDNAATFKTGSSDYQQQEINGYGTSPSYNYYAASSLYLVYQAATGSSYAMQGSFELDPGGGGTVPSILSRFYSVMGSTGYGQHHLAGVCNTISTNRVTTIRLTTSGGGFTAQSIVLWGEPG